MVVWLVSGQPQILNMLQYLRMVLLEVGMFPYTVYKPNILKCNPSIADLEQFYV